MKKVKRELVEFSEPVMINNVAVYGGLNGKHLVLHIPDTMNKQSLYNWRERNFDKLYELTRRGE